MRKRLGYHRFFSELLALMTIDALIDELMLDEAGPSNSDPS